MAIEDVFNGAKTTFTFFFAYLNAVAQEIGMERAIAVDTKACETMGAIQGKMMRERSGMKEFDCKAAWSLVKTGPESLGITMEKLEESPQRVVSKMGRCPVYEAAQMLGMDAKTIETGCRAASIRFMDAVAKQLNPSLSFRLRKFRSAPDDFCEEEIVLG